jgi:hypothetical protein
MKPSSLAKRVDMIGMSTLALLIILSFSFKSSPIAFMNPGFPMLREGDLG